MESSRNRSKKRNTITKKGRNTRWSSSSAWWHQSQSAQFNALSASSAPVFLFKPEKSVFLISMLSILSLTKISWSAISRNFQTETKVQLSVRHVAHPLSFSWSFLFITFFSWFLSSPSSFFLSYFKCFGEVVCSRFGLCTCIARVTLLVWPLF